ncbi:MAG: outer rane efflux protein [Nevskia sp.]|nr:outer rane efflux protein [Nevskia sp.]
MPECCPNRLLPRLVIALLVGFSSAPAFAAAGDGCASVLSLNDAEARLPNDPDLRLARHAVDGAVADLTSAGERPNPSLNLSSSAYDVRHGLGPGNAWDKQVDSVIQFEQPIERGGKRGLRQAAARQGIVAADADFADQKRQALLALRQAFYDLQLAEQKLAIDRDIADAQAATQHAAEQRLHAGDIAAADVARLRVETSKADNDVRQAETDLAAARIALAYLIGCGADAAFSISGDWPVPGELPAPDDANSTQRADVAAARARAAQAHSSLDLAKAQRTRDISVGVQVEHYPGGPPAPSDGDVLLGFDVSVPLHLFHAYQGEIARASSDAAAGEDALAQTQAQAAADLARAHSDLLASAARARNFHDSILPQAQTAADAIEYAYARGALPLLDLLDARRTLHSTRIDAATAQSAYAKALAAWRAVTERYDAPTRPQE